MGGVDIRTIQRVCGGSVGTRRVVVHATILTRMVWSLQLPPTLSNRRKNEHKHGGSELALSDVMEATHMTNTSTASRTFTMLFGLGLIGMVACTASTTGSSEETNSTVADLSGSTSSVSACTTTVTSHHRRVTQNVPNGTVCPGGTCSNGQCVASTPTPPADAGTDSATDSGSTTTDSGTTTGFDQFQMHNLATINAYRASIGVPPLVLDIALDTFAQAGSVELSKDHTPHQHFITAANNGTIWSSGFSGAAAEDQGDPNGWPVMSSDPTQNELDQIDSIMAAMWAEGPTGGHYQNMANAVYTRLGVGLLEIKGSLYLTNDFSK